MCLNNYCTGLQHIGIPTLDIIKSKEFYNGLGFTCIHEKKIRNNTQQVCFMQLKGLILELYEEEKVANKAGAIDHLAINVTDIEAVYQSIKQNHYTFVESEIQSLPFFDKGVRYFIILGPNQEKIEFNQYL